MSAMPTADPPEGDGATDWYWFDGYLMRVLLPAATTGGRLSVIEQRQHRGYGTPVHLHEREDQTLHVLEGSITAWLDPQGDRSEQRVGAGETVFLPRGVPHAFRVVDEGTRLLEINTPGGFEGFHLAAGLPAPGARIPEGAEADLDLLVRVGAEYGCSVLGPPVD